jgi:hypothetical protein
MIAATMEKALELANSLEQTAFVPLFPGVAEVVQRAFILPLRHRVTGVKVDLAIGLSGFEQLAVSRAKFMKLAGREVMVATAEDLIIMKSVAGRPQDEQDLQGLVMSQAQTIDWEYCLQMATDLGEAIGQDIAARVRRLKRSAEVDS